VEGVFGFLSGSSGGYFMYSCLFRDILIFEKTQDKDSRVGSHFNKAAAVSFRTRCDWRITQFSQQRMRRVSQTHKSTSFVLK